MELPKIVLNSHLFSFPGIYVHPSSHVPISILFSLIKINYPKPNTKVHDACYLKS